MPGAGWSSLASSIVAVTVAIATVDHGDGRRPELWSLTVAVASGVGAGLLAAGASGRLAMRLLAVTAGADAQGRITEAEQVVGRISVDGTLGSSSPPACTFGWPQEPPTCCCTVGGPPAGPGASPTAPCSWSSPAPGLSRCA
jgi:hypothetical protein